jgi:hypothetical protein
VLLYFKDYRLISTKLIAGIEKYNITGENLYNWDEKGFLLGLAQTVKRIMTLYAYKTGRIMGASQDGSREFLSLLACICADGTKLPPALIYQGDHADLLDTWVEDFNEGDEAYFAATSNGWSCDSLGLQWLQKVFHPHTKDKAGNRRRLLIVDGHSSHVNLQFIEWADRHRILIMILPPHSTHRLQPLDVSLFQPLATAYSQQISKLMSDSLGLVSMNKRLFWPMFKASWQASFSEKNITSAFAKTGIFPYKPSEVLDKITRPAPPPAPISQERTPMTCRSVRRIHKAYKKSPTEQRLNFILHANSRLAAQHSIDQHTITGLIGALQTEKKKRSRGKRLNLVGEEDNGPLLMSPSQVLRAKAISNEKEAQEQAEQDRIAAKKAAAAANKVRKEQEKAERALRTAERRRLAAEKKLQHAVDVQARKELRAAQKAAKTLSQTRIPPTKITKVAPKPTTKPRELAVVAQNEVGSSQVKITTSRGRTTMRTVQSTK